MQALDRVSTVGTSYTAAQVTGFLNARTGQEAWRFERLDAGGRFLSDLTPYVSFETVPDVSYDARQAVKRTARLWLRGDATINPQIELVRPWYRLRAPDGGWLEWPLGTFVMPVPDKTIGRVGTWGALTMTDLSQLLVDACITSALSVPTGASYVSGVAAIAATYGGPIQIQTQIPDGGKRLPATMVWDPGTTRLQIITDLLAAIAYTTPWFDEFGILRASPLPDYTLAVPSYTFDTISGGANIADPFTERADPSKLVRKVVVIGEDPRRAAIYQSYENSAADSPARLSARIKVIRNSNISDAASAYALARSEAQAGARLAVQSAIASLPWALSQDLDVYRLVYTNPDEGRVDRNYLEVSWRHMCKTGEPTAHVWERIVAA